MTPKFILLLRLHLTMGFSISLVNEAQNSPSAGTNCVVPKLLYIVRGYLPEQHTKSSDRWCVSIGGKGWLKVELSGVL